MRKIDIGFLKKKKMPNGATFYEGAIKSSWYDSKNVTLVEGKDEFGSEGLRVLPSETIFERFLDKFGLLHEKMR